MGIPEREIWEEIVKTVAEALSEELKLSKTTLEDGSFQVPVEVSNRHCHLTKETFEILFGKGKQLTPIRSLSQLGEFACEETVAVIGKNMRMLEKVRIVGPWRNYDQVELSFTDGFYLGLELPTRLSGDIANSSPITLVGPQGIIALKEGAIRAARHLHLSPEEAERFKLKNGDRVSVEIPGQNGLILNQVIVRVGPTGRLACHIDTDEANAAGLRGKGIGRVIR